MRRYLLLILTICSVLAAMTFGIIKRQTYTDMTKEEYYLAQLQVGELPENIAEVQCDRMRQSLPEAPLIIRVEVTGEIEHSFKVDRQKAVVREIYAGSGLEKNEEIYIFSDHWKLSLDGNPNSTERGSIERGFVNIMDVGTEYLIFAKAVVENPTADIPLVKVYDDFTIAPVFCCEERQNTAIPTGEENTYVPYRDVMDNEFFGTSERALQLMEELKAQMLQLYLKQDT